MTFGRLKEWFVCDNRDTYSGTGGETCLYDGATVHRLKSDPLRCVKHGALLFYDRTLDGCSRVQARKRMKEWYERR